MIVGDWRTEPNALVRELVFRDYAEALGFVTEMGTQAVDYQRRPDVSIVDFNHVRICVDNLHDAGITEAERRLARKVDAVIDQYRQGITRS
jgi:pterin-4a-carbinolamine dehydratase